MTLSYTRRLHLAIPDFLTEPWHAEFAQAMDSIDSAIYNAIVSAGTELWIPNHVYTVGDIIIEPTTGTLYAAAASHTSGPGTFAQDIQLHPEWWTSFAVDVATQAEAEAGIENTHYMTALRTAQAIDAQSPTPGVATQPQAEEGSDNVTMMTPLRTKQNVTARLATQAEAEAGTDNTKLMTPLRVFQAIDEIGLPGGAQIAFGANKNGVSQSGIVNNTFTKLTFTTEFYDLGNVYDTANSRWTPPAGLVHIDISVVCTGVTAGGQTALAVFKNGVLLKQSTIASQASAGTGAAQVGVDDVANGTDYYEAFVSVVTAGTASVSGIISDSWFYGHFLGETSAVTIGHAEHGFRAHKNGVNQTPGGVETKVTFGTEVYDQGGYYEPATSRWTPPTGMVHITAALTYILPAAGYWDRVYIYKNGIPLAHNIKVSSYPSESNQISVDDVASGTDYYEVFAFQPNGQPISGTANETYFCGHRVGGPRGEQGDPGPTGPPGTVAGSPTLPQGRLTIVANTPVVTESTTGATVIRYTPYIGNRIPVFDGSGMVMMAFTELSQALGDGSKSPAPAVPEAAYDLFVWNDGGTGRISRGLPWSNSATVAISSPASPAVVTWVNHGLHEGSAVVFSTTGALPTGIAAGTIYYVGRNVTPTTFSISTTIQNAFLGTFVSTTGTTQSGTHTGTNRDSKRGVGTGTTELTRVQGFLVNAFGILNGPLINQGTYVGSIRTNGAGTVDWLYGSSAVNGGQASHNIWNCYNRVDVMGMVQEGLGSWQAGLYNAWRALNQSTANRVSAFFGLAEDPWEAHQSIGALGDYSGGWMGCAVAMDSSSLPTGSYTGKHIHTGNMYSHLVSDANGIGIGSHYWQALEFAYYSQYYNAPTFWGNGGIASVQGMRYSMKM